MLYRTLALFGILFLVAACGFQPLYGRQTENAKVTYALDQTYILPIDGRVGQIVRNHLLDKVSPRSLPSNAAYQLQVRIREEKENLAIDRSNSSNRNNLTLRANYQLLDSTGKNIVYQGSAQAIASFNIVDSDFANLAAEKNAQKRSAIVLSEEIHRQLSVYFSR
ncbi:LPS assembly lipoprotein LptE [Sneathiella glossodoripedis]|uniref:LPS assembly lipoprotein LptE n=1 Tax=Sneathiella glossodoripedis TaxID=418853 RepID=UPI0004705552|nr:LPS assembly lipoprotein LptE [Sneathiella glossodoripedis]